MKTRALNFWLVIFVTLALLAMARVAAAEEDHATRQPDSRTVIGPLNPYLTDGADALLRGDGEEGVRLTLRGLEVAQGRREEMAALSNLCAGYLLIDKPLKALDYCNQVLQRDPRHWRAYNNRALVYMRLDRLVEADADIHRGQELSPNSQKLKLTKGRLLDKTDPVTAVIEVDERRVTKKQADDEGR